MKLVHAIWEQKNMGVDCWEVTVEQGDCISELERRAEVYETEYTVIKVPAGMVEFYFYLQKAGYTFIETAVSCHHDTRMPLLNRIQQKIWEQVTYCEMNGTDREKLFEEIEHGMFATDRISLDSHFTAKQASDRYIGWIKQETTNGADLYKVMYKSEDVGFFTYKDIGNGVYFPFLGGLYKENAKAGIGVTLNLCEIEEAGKRNAKKMLSAYSTNNRGASAIHLQMGYILDEIMCVFVKHN